MKRIVLKHGNYNRFCTCNVTHYAYTHRGERFRVEFANISEVRSLINQRDSFRVILSTLDMNGCYLVLENTILDINFVRISYH